MSSATFSPEIPDDERAPTLEEQQFNLVQQEYEEEKTRHGVLLYEDNAALARASALRLLHPFDSPKNMFDARTKKGYS